MAKVTSKLQVTVPKALAETHGIAPGDEIDWQSAGDAIRLVPARNRTRRDRAWRAHLFDQATQRQRKRSKTVRVPPSIGRGWTREEIYDRGRAR